ncbi:MAG: hypothetical protein AB7K68_01935 [Bacteriovoracia bacterium]
MDGMPLRFSLRAILPAVLVIFTACGQVNSEKATVNGPSTQAGAGGSGGSTVPVPAGPVVNAAGFFVALTGSSNSAMAPYFHQADAAYGATIGTTNFSSECKIADGSADGNDVLCVAEVEELDLYFNKLKIQYHVPSDMCTYVRTMPYWFWAYGPGNGPTIVSHEILADKSIRDVTNTSNGTAQCSYDYSTAGGPNCCIGTYSHTVTTYASDGTFTKQTDSKEWTGEASNCAAGPAMEIQQAKSADGLPLATIEWVQNTGLNRVVTYNGPIDATFGASSRVFSNVWTGNFYNPLDHTGGKPIGLQVPSGLTSPNTLHLPQDTYDFQCLDGAYDIRQRIRLFIRDWNTHSAMGEGGDPDLTGSEPSYPTFPLNDRSDWLDFGDLYPASNL